MSRREQLAHLKHPVLSIVGPTASGKSSLAIAVAQKLNAEIVSADSMQIYRFMDIGTAKVDLEKTSIKHYGIDIIDPGQAYSAQLFQDYARDAFLEINQKDKVPLLCGGTGFYVQAALEDMQFPSGKQTDNPLRDYYQAYAESHGPGELWQLLKEKDPVSAEVIHPHNVRRVIRALEMYEEGISYAEQAKNIRNLPAAVPSVRFALRVDPDVLARRINTRVDQMIEQGLVQEVQDLMQKGFKEALTAPQAIGYKEIVAYLEGQLSLEDATEQIKTATRRYAKRQRSWFKRDSLLIWLEATHVNQDELVDDVISLYRHHCSESNTLS